MRVIATYPGFRSPGPTSCGKGFPREQKKRVWAGEAWPALLFAQTGKNSLSEPHCVCGYGTCQGKSILCLHLLLQPWSSSLPQEPGAYLAEHLTFLWQPGRRSQTLGLDLRPGQPPFCFLLSQARARRECFHVASPPCLHQAADSGGSE